MPELSSIQTFEDIEGLNFEPTLSRFSNLLKKIDLWNAEIKTAFDNFELKDDGGFVFTNLMALNFSTSKYPGIKIRPLLMVYTPTIDKTFKSNWVCCKLLIEAEQLRSFADGQFHSYTYDLVEALTFEMQKEFKQTGIYFTDEAQHGSDFEGVRCNDLTKLWQFDYALIPTTLYNLYSDRPVTHKIKRYENYFESWYIDRWKGRP